MQSEPADPLGTPPPSFSLSQAERLARSMFGVRGTASSLDSERDQNFRLTTDDGALLFKISNPADDPRVLEMQTQAMLHIARVDPELPVMQPLRVPDGDHHASVEGPDGRIYLTRLFTFLEGNVRPARDLDPGALEAFGATTARVGKALRGFFHPAGSYEILWDLQHTRRLRPFAELIEEAERRSLVERVLQRFDDEVRGVLPRLRGQLIHNDLTLDNVLLDEGMRVAGIVDFGDLTHSSLVCDPAISLVSLMWGREDPIKVARHALRGYVSEVPLDDEELSVLGDLIGARLVALVTIASLRVRRYPENAAYITAHVDLAWRLLEYLDRFDWCRLQEVLRSAPSSPGGPYAKEDLVRRRDAALGPALSPLSYDDPLYLVRGEGAWLFDAEGTGYLDAYNNVPVVGHSHPRVVSAIAEQSSKLNTNTRYLHESVVELAERLIETMPAGLDTVMFYNSGSEANDIAWRLAMTFTGATGAIVTHHAYHGVTSATIDLSPEEWVDPQGPGHVVTVPAPPRRARNDSRREQPATRSPDEPGGAQDRGDGWVDAFESALARLGERGLGPAAFYLDSLFTSDGIFTPAAEAVRRGIEKVRDAGGLFVADEVQAGYGRSGTHLWSFERFAVVPDLVTLGKPMGNGHPVAAVITRREIAERFASTIDMFSTFGGNPVAARAALAVLDVVQDEALVRHAHDVGMVLRARLEEAMHQHPAIRDVRGAGLLIGVDIVTAGTDSPDPALARRLMNSMRNRQILIGTTGPHDSVLKIRPPLVMTTHEAIVVADALIDCLEEERS